MYSSSDYDVFKLELLRDLNSERRQLSPREDLPQSIWWHHIVRLLEVGPAIVDKITALFETFAVQCARSLYQLPYFSQFQRPWLFIGSQEGCDGDFPAKKAEEVRIQLERRREPGIIFNKRRITGSLKGGTCSAMSLDFVDTYLKLKNAHIKTKDHQAKALFNRIRELGSRFAKSSEEMRIRQAAYNTIEVQPFNVPVDYSKNKIQSLANYHSLHIDFSSREIDIRTIQSGRDLQHAIDPLPKGAYIVRILKPSLNERLEEHGHTLVYIKEHDIGLLYDPNCGAKDLSEINHSQALYEVCTKCFLDYRTYKTRLYRVQRSEIPRTL